MVLVFWAKLRYVLFNDIRVDPAVVCEALAAVNRLRTANYLTTGKEGRIIRPLECFVG
jgi:hypothetical protein